MTKKIFIAVSAASVLFIFWVLLFDGCGKTTDSHQDDFNEVTAERDSALAREKAGKRRVDSLTQSLLQRDTIIKVLKDETEKSRIELDRSKSLAYRLSVELQGYKNVKDTSEYGRKLDSLLAEVIVLTGMLNNYEMKVDSLTSKLELQQRTYDRLLTERAELYTQLRSSYDVVTKKYNLLFVDYNDRGKSMKQERLKSKVAALLALVATGLFIAK